MTMTDATVRHIHTFRELRDHETPPKSGRIWECGCECRFGTMWKPCPFHDGFNAAVLAREMNPPEPYTPERVDVIIAAADVWIDHYWNGTFPSGMASDPGPLIAVTELARTWRNS